jgi:hypothetical protein
MSEKNNGPKEARKNKNIEQHKKSKDSSKRHSEKSSEKKIEKKGTKGEDWNDPTGNTHLGER